jgi:hypothetical protein
MLDCKRCIGRSVSPFCIFPCLKMKEAKQIEPFRERKGKDIARSLTTLICLHGIVFKEFEFAAMSRARSAICNNVLA